MDFEFLSDYVVLVVAGICFCVGYVVKNYLPADNKHIPTIMLCLGTALNIWLNDWSVTPVIVLSGMVSGLAATGFHQVIKQNKSEVIEK